MLNLLQASGFLMTFLSIIVAVLVLLVMITVHELGHYIAGKIFKFKINEFAIGFGKPIYRRIGKNGEAFSIRLVPLGGYCAFDGEDTEGESEGTFNSQAPWKRLIVLFSGAFMNFLFSMLVVVMSFSIYGQFMHKVDAIIDVNNVESLGIETFAPDDIIVSVNGKDVYLADDIKSALKNVSLNEYVMCDVIRGGERQTIKVLYREYTYTPILENDQKGEPVTTSGFGVNISTTNYKFSFFENIGRGLVYIFKMLVETIMIPAKLISGIYGINDIGGPITTIGLTAQVVQLGFHYLLEITAMIGISLAVFNLFPIPALDGSRMVFTIIEWIRKKPINRKVEAYIHATGLILLFGLVIIVDIMHFI